MVKEREPIRVVVWGLDRIGVAMANLVSRREGVTLAGAIAAEDGQTGRDVGELIGFGERLEVTVSSDPSSVLTDARPDVTLIATGSRTDEVAPLVLRAIEAGSNVICIAEEMTYPWATRPDLADNLDELAHAHGVTVLGTGVSPGFVMDTLAIALSGCCMDVERIRASRAINLAPLGAGALRAYGIGLSPSKWAAGEEQGRHHQAAGLEQSIHLISDALGWSLERVDHDRRPVIAEVRIESEGLRIDPGQVAGRMDAAVGYVNGLAKIVLEHPQVVNAVSPVVQTGDFVEIEGKPNIHLAIQPEIAALEGTAAIAVNMIPAVMLVGPGLKTMADLPVPRAMLGDMRQALQARHLTVEEELARGWHEQGLGGHEEGLSAWPGEF